MNDDLPNGKIQSELSQNQENIPEREILAPTGTAEAVTSSINIKRLIPLNLRA